MNTIWLALDEDLCVPQRIALLHTPSDPIVRDASVPACIDAIDVLSDAYGLDPAPVLELGSRCQFEEEAPRGFVRALRGAVERAETLELGIVMDITAGRKYMSAMMTLMAALHRTSVHAIYYTHLYSRDYEHVLYPLIPRPEHEVRDLGELVDPPSGQAGEGRRS
ncbi:MAG: hypothetical protein U9R79_04680 [Armatimonadota bacterium]|nr:hypothetical protein [Armatimonadota bacterium]